MANNNKARGTRWETALQNYWRRVTGPTVAVYKPRQEGHADNGDLHVDEDFVVQAKDWERWSRQNLYDWVDAAQLQAVHAGRPWGVACVKRRKGKGSSGKVETGVVAMTVETFGELVNDLAEGREALKLLEEMDYE